MKLNFPRYPKTSFVIRTFNEAKWLSVVLENLFAQSRLDFEIIVVDSGSTDRTLAILKKFPIRKIISIEKKDFNYAFALNLGIKEAWGEIVGVISGHSLPVSRTWYEDGLKHFANRKVAAVSGYFTPLPDSSYEEKMWSLHQGAATMRFETKSKWMTNTNALLRKSLWESYPFDERITGGHELYGYATEGCEDYDWATEMLARGYLIIKEPKFNVYHSHGGIKRIEQPDRVKKWDQICALIDQKKRPSKSYTVLKFTKKVNKKRSFFARLGLWFSAIFK